MLADTFIDKFPFMIKDPSQRDLCLRIFLKYGEIPLPPYMTREVEKLDEDRYETVYADPKKRESVAAPTAGFQHEELYDIWLFQLNDLHLLINDTCS